MFSEPQTAPPQASVSELQDAAARVRNVMIDGRRTRIRLENEIWNAMQEICRFESLEIDKLCAMISRRAQRKLSLSSAIRVFVVDYYRTALGVSQENVSP